MNAIPSAPNPITDRLPTLPVKRLVRPRTGPSTPKTATAADFNGLPAHQRRTAAFDNPDRPDLAPLADAVAPRPQARSEADLRPARRTEAERRSPPEPDLRSRESGLQASRGENNRIAHRDRARSSYLPTAAPALFQIR